MNRHKGFTLIELMIVVTIIAVVASIALPNLRSARMASNETAAIATLRNLISAQAQFQTRSVVDEDNDGVGEYGTIGEMSGKVVLRGTANYIRPPILSTSFRSINANGETVRAGYQFRLWLPGALGVGLGEEAGGGISAPVDPEIAETTWCAYAWPSSYEQSGYRTFFVNQVGEMLFTADPSYTGPGGFNSPGAALNNGGNIGSITGSLATGVTGRDGNLWKAVQD